MRFSKQLSLIEAIGFLASLTGLLVILAACGATAGEEGDPQPAAPTEAPVQEAASVESPTEAAPTMAAPTALATAESAVMESATVEPMVTATPAEVESAGVEATAAAPAEAVAVNGLYEQTFFRGRADAPVIFIDYSDFL